MFSGPHRVELRDHDVLKIFTSRFDEQVARYRALHRHLDGASLPSGWRARVPALTAIDSDAASVVITRAPGFTLQQARDIGQAVPWRAIGEALGRLHRISRETEGEEYVHGDVAPANVMFFAGSREIWLIDPEVQANGGPWRDLLFLQWCIFRNGWGLAAAPDLFRGWRRAYGLAWSNADIDRGWAEVLKTHVTGQSLLPWSRRALRWGFRYLWIPLALWLSRLT
jgi:hypothetical protein